MKQLLAHYVHCTAHASHLVTALVARSCSVISTTLQCVNEIGVLVSQSGKLKAGSPNQIKPLCPTRWQCRVGPVRSTLEHYSAVLVKGLLNNFGQGNTCLGIVIAQQLKLQNGYSKILGERKNFYDIFERCNSYVEKLYLVPVKTPYIEKPPKKYSSEANCHVETDARKYFRNQFYEALDTAVVQTEVWFQQSGIEQYKKLETILMSREVSEVVDSYPKIDSDSLKLQVPLFRKLHKFSSLEQGATEL
ncbi:hypothetical protein PR048_011404 [Dryococelus australis]|uniref:Uncharacterized protein n=1 Tax=Dryococelus australis TaxID=614101 RepID=A0ABQ9HLH1_9NEOP|nr:hypothetical protein PR048_011404 [Dryococelus australis]